MPSAGESDALGAKARGWLSGARAAPPQAAPSHLRSFFGAEGVGVNGEVRRFGLNHGTLRSLKLELKEKKQTPYTLERRLRRKTGQAPAERTREFLSTRGASFAPSRFLLHETPLRPLFLKQAAIPVDQDAALGANKPETPPSPYLSRRTRLPGNQPAPERPKRTPRCGFFFRADCDHFRGDR